MAWRGKAGGVLTARLASQLGFCKTKFNMDSGSPTILPVAVYSRSVFQKLDRGLSGVQYNDVCPEKIQIEDVRSYRHKSVFAAYEMRLDRPYLILHSAYLTHSNFFGMSKRLPTSGRRLGPGGKCDLLRCVTYTRTSVERTSTTNGVSKEVMKGCRIAKPA